MWLTFKVLKRLKGLGLGLKGSWVAEFLCTLQKKKKMYYAFNPIVESSLFFTGVPHWILTAGCKMDRLMSVL